MNLDNEGYLTLEDLGDFTLDELEDFTLDELSMPVDKFIESLKDKQKDIPYDTYARLEKLCHDVSSSTKAPITIPTTYKIGSALNTLASIMTILTAIPEFYNVYSPIVKELFKTILHLCK